VLGWECWRRGEVTTATGRRWVSVTGWNVMHPTRMAFEGVAIPALLAMLVAATYLWSSHVPGWAAIAGGVAGWVLGAALTAGLHRVFERASDV
jgi:hypothetical protein